MAALTIYSDFGAPQNKEVNILRGVDKNESIGQKKVFMAIVSFSLSYTIAYKCAHLLAFYLHPKSF